MAMAAASEQFGITVSRADAGVTVYVTGVFDAASVDAFGSVVSPLLYERREPPIEIDVCDLTYLSGSGLGAIVFAIQFARGHGQICYLTGATGQPRTLLSTVALTRGAMSEDVLGALN
jgi:anti-anti-sigma factor